MKDGKVKQVLSGAGYQWEEGGQVWWMYCTFVYENRTMELAEIVLGRPDGDEEKRWRVNLIKT
jgi:hypothetical protein